MARKSSVHYINQKCHPPGVEPEGEPGPFGGLGDMASISSKRVVTMSSSFSLVMGPFSGMFARIFAGREGYAVSVKPIYGARSARHHGESCMNVHQQVFWSYAQVLVLGCFQHLEQVAIQRTLHGDGCVRDECCASSEHCTSRIQGIRREHC